MPQFVYQLGPYAETHAAVLDAKNGAPFIGEPDSFTLSQTSPAAELDVRNTKLVAKLSR